MNCKALLFIVFTLLLASSIYAQKQTLIGLNLNTNIYPDQITWNELSIGAVFEKQFTQRSGIETGLYYRTGLRHSVVSFTDSTGPYSYSSTVSERYFAIPILYKYYSRLVNFSVGPALDFYIGWKQKHKGSSVQIQSYDVNPKVKLGFLAKVSKPIPLKKPFLFNKPFILEPEIRFGSVQTLDEANIGIGLSGKYRF